MRDIEKFILLCIVVVLMGGCSRDANEIGDIAIDTAVALDYNIKSKEYTFTSYCVLPANSSQEKAGSFTQKISSETGSTLLEAGKKMRSHAGKNAIYQHNKFFIVGEDAARYSLYEVVDYLTRKREFRITSFPIITKGLASDKLKLKPESGDMVSNDLLGQIRNNKLLGQSAPILLKDFVNLFSNPYRGFVAASLILKPSESKNRDVPLLSGGAVIYKEKLVSWLNGNDVLVVNILTNKKIWRNLEFPENIESKSGLDFTSVFHVSNSEIHSEFSNGNPVIRINMKLDAAVESVNQDTKVLDSANINQMEKAAAEHIEKVIKTTLSYFQKDLKVDIIGFSDVLIQHYPNEWKVIQKDWENIYPTMPIQTHVSVKIERAGMTTSIGGKD
ncbi:Ger(x)C family spore germination protein [Paenibacillus sp. CGMCC 1.16610]|uniref:Ger(X)C family spore germination protein n=1 Tax=Paenibacillus anseongense TaxID=2682845 RepID=A0ABW9UGJ3_9BACL|nr:MULTISPECIES: Ger(x)C family spore germination protein [Paenibacillus]MBA2939628.1 Ger(x)C family spore germination protein [Paenibacillus sp. CGMCC 1.16610]MVQ39289.1 Ger(x)C family spore germination protein [Paenibacillus anseongense]